MPSRGPSPDGRSFPMQPRFQRRKEQLLAGCQVSPTLFRGVMNRLEVFTQPFAASLLSVGLVPLAALADMGELGLPGLVQCMAARINTLPPTRAATLWTATYLLMGLRYEDEVIDKL